MNIAVHNPWHAPTDQMVHSERSRGISRRVRIEKYTTRVSEGLNERWSSRYDKTAATKVAIMFSTPDVVDNLVWTKGVCDWNTV
jgi:hypothetical protein